MTSLPLEKVNTKLEAFKLIHDPTRLFYLLYSKYGDIEDDYFISFTNQLIFNIPTNYNRIYKESLFLNNIREFLRRYYRKYETKDRIPKLSDYYKNYIKFFCRPFFKQLSLGKIVYNFQDKQAEIFYKQNYNDTLDYEKEKEKEKKVNSEKKSSDELSSLDNITNNEIIFDERTKKIINNGLNNEMCTLTLESSRVNNLNNNLSINSYAYEGELISKRSNANYSFEKVVHYLIHSQFKKKIENKKNKKQTISKKKLINSPSAHPPYLSKLLKKNYYNINSINRDFLPKNNKIKNSLYTLAKNNFIKTGGFSNYNINRGFLSPKLTKNNMNMNPNNIMNSKNESNKKYKYNNHINSFHNFTYKNKMNYSNNQNITNIKKIYKTKNKRFNTNTIYKNFSNLSETLNKYKQLSYKNSNMTTTANKNNFNISKSKRINFANSSNILTKSINKIDILKKNQNNKNFQLNLNETSKINKLQFHHTKNKTFDFNSLQQNDNLSKIKANNNYKNYRVFINKKEQIEKKISKKFNLIKKPISEVVSHIVSPSHKKLVNKTNKEKSISNRKDKTKKIFFGLFNYNKSNNIKTNKFDSPKYFSVSGKNKTFNTEENNRNENLNLESIIKESDNKYKSNRKQEKNKNNYIKNKENIFNWKIKTSGTSPLSNYTSNYNKLIKNKKYGSFNNTMKNENNYLLKKEEQKINKRVCNNKINNNLENNKNNFNNNNKNNKDFLEMMNGNIIFSRNKKQNTSKISSTKSQNEINLRDICIKSIKNLKSSEVRSKKNLFNRTCLNKNKKYRDNHYFNIINSSSELQNIHKKNLLTKFSLKRLSIKKKTKKFSQRVSLKKVKKKIYKNQKGNNANKINLIFNGDVIINKNQLIEIKQNNNNNNNNKIINNDIKNKNNLLTINGTNKERGNSSKIINVNRNNNLINKREQNINI